IWVGPPPDAIAAMASKTRAKRLARTVLEPTESTESTESADRSASPTEAELPLLVKAAAGGGGRGMRIVRTLDELPAALAAARAEAVSAFGDGEVFTEPYIERGRHVEVQLLADTAGTVWTLGTRDCSLQRRHQKVVEECPAPGLDAGTTAFLQESAAALARAVGYTGAGTVEFLLPPSGRPHFLEMNTRLQVEHPVTEEVFGLDLVAWQLRIAEGRPLPPEPPAPRGHAVEARLYAEDPARDWAPQSGVLHRLSVPGGPGLRVDGGYADGDTVPVHYDALLAKVVAWAPTREEALRRLSGALERATVHGPATGLGLLVRSLRHPEVTEARMDTSFYARHLDGLTRRAPDPYAPLAAALGAAAASPSRFGGWRNLPYPPQVRRYRTEADGAEHEVRYRHTRDGLAAADPGGAADVRVVRALPGTVVLEVDGVRRSYELARYPGGRVYAGNTALTALPRFPDPARRHEPGSLLAPMPGTVVRVADGVVAGARVAAGQPLLWLEAMKMEHRVTAPAAGVLTALYAEPGRQVEPGALLAVVQEDGDGGGDGQEGSEENGNENEDNEDKDEDGDGKEEGQKDGQGAGPQDHPVPEDVSATPEETS
ncbi:biotin/lipoyl-containing protein, partial [Streptomyces clavuligerus]